MKKEIREWLANRQRKYADGLALFLSCASEDFIKKYGGYFKEADGEPNQFDPHFTMLINKLTVIESKMKFSVQPVATEETINKEKPVDEKSKKGKENKKVRIVKDADLPEHLLESYNRIKEITPLYAALKTEIADVKLTDDERKEKAEELCALDDERRKNWAVIDDWAQGEDVTLDTEENNPDEEFSEDAFTKGVQLANAIKRTKENLTRSQESAKKFEEEGKLNKAENAKLRAEKYQKELDNLTRLLENANKS